MGVGESVTPPAGKDETGPLLEERVVALEGVHLAFGRPVLSGVSLEVRTSESLLIVGESGTGKTTILRLILRLLIPDKGRVFVYDEDISDISFEDALQLRARMGMVFQGAALFDSLTVFENVAYPLREHRNLAGEELAAIVNEKLEFVDLDPADVGSRLPAELSGGMRKRVGIARAMANNPKVMLYDEPTAGLDPLTSGTIVKLIRKLQRETGVTSVIVSHDLHAMLPVSSRVAMLRDQTIGFSGTPTEMRASTDPYIREFLGGDE